MIYLSIYKFPVKKFIWLRFNFHLKLVITTKKVKFAIEQNAFKVWHISKPNLCNKPIHKLCWTWRIQLCWTDLLKSGGGLYYKLGQVLQSEATLLQSGASIIAKQGSFTLL